MPSGKFIFDDFELFEENASLLRGGVRVALPPRAFALLCALVGKAGQLSRKEALLDAVWGHRHISESVLKNTVSEVRAALGDDARQPRYIETVSRYGYRFIGQVSQTDELTTVTRPVVVSNLVPSRSGEVIGRGAALQQMQSSWEQAGRGSPRLLWIAGDAGIGKSTLIDGFVSRVGAQSAVIGQCVEQFGAGEPYLPVLEALKALAKRDPASIPLLRSVAPMWLVQLPWLLSDTDRGSLQAGFSGVAQERMVREFAELLERYTHDRPLLIVTEDLHWSDHGTLRLMDHFARQRGSAARVLWVASFRLTQAIAEDHPLQHLRQELRLHGLCNEIILDPLSEADIAEMVGSRLAHPAPAAFIRKLHAHTDGLPLFVSAVLDNLFPRDSAISDVEALAAAAGQRLPVPDNLAGVVDRQLARLDDGVRNLLMAASACGVEFLATAAAAALDMNVQLVTQRCEELVRQGYWMRHVGVVELPDGSLDVRFAFRHAVYRHVLYERLSAAYLITAHRRLAAYFAQKRERGEETAPTELALHHELGREYVPAVEAYAVAAQCAQRQFAPQEAVELTTHALSLLSQCPAARRDELELALRAARGNALGAIEGIASPRSVADMERVRELCDWLPQSPERALLLNGLGWGLYVRGEFAQALAVGRRVHSVAEAGNDALLLVFARNLLGTTYATMGRATLAVECLQTGLDEWQHLAEPARAPGSLFVDPEISMRANLATPLVQLGRFDEARAEVERATSRADAVGQPLDRMLAAWCACIVAVRLEQPEVVAAQQPVLEKIADAGIWQAAGPAAWFRGWLAIRRGEFDAGYADVRRGYSLYEGIGMYAGCTEVIAFCVEARIAQGAWDHAQQELDEAFAISERIDERQLLPELLLLRARIAAGQGDSVTARRTLEEACELARKAGAAGSELKIRTALAMAGSATVADRLALREFHASLKQGADTRPMQRVRELLAS